MNASITRSVGGSYRKNGTEKEEIRTGEIAGSRASEELRKKTGKIEGFSTGNFGKRWPTTWTRCLRIAVTAPENRIPPRKSQEPLPPTLKRVEMPFRILT